MKFPQQVIAHPQFSYSFVADGQVVMSKDDSFDQTDDKSVGSVVAKYPENTEITIHYLTSDPNQSYFEHAGASNHSPVKIAIFVAGCLLLLFAMQFLFKLGRLARTS